MEEKKSKCRIVQCKEFYSITAKCFKAIMPDKSELLIPASQFYGYARNKGGYEYIYLTDWICITKGIYEDYLLETVWLKQGEADEITIEHKPEYLPPAKGVKADESLVR